MLGWRTNIVQAGSLEKRIRACCGVGSSDERNGGSEKSPPGTACELFAELSKLSANAIVSRLRWACVKPCYACRPGARRQGTRSGTPICLDCRQSDVQVVQ